MSFMKLNGVEAPNDIEKVLFCIDQLMNDGGLTDMDFKFQNGTVKEVGENGFQWYELLKIALRILQNLNDKFPCRENTMTITKIQEALMWQDQRTKERIRRGVEGLSKK